MISLPSRLFSNSNNANIMKVIRDSAKETAKQFTNDGLKQFYTRWGDNMYEEGLKITDEVKFKDFVRVCQDDLASIKRQATIRNLFPE